ncbi:beta-ketoacyl-ACP synthase II [Nannocystaceae bacterium ST9]
MRRVVVTGMGAVSPCGATMAATWDALVHARSGVAPVEGFDVSDLRCHVAGQCRDFDPKAFFDKSTLRHTSRFIHLGVAAAQMAVDEAGLDFEREVRARVGVMLGVGMAPSQNTVDAHEMVKEKGAARLWPFFIPATISNMVVGHVSMRFGLHGPSFSPASACSSGAHAIGTSFDLIRAGRADVMLAGGCEGNCNRITMCGFDALRALATDDDPPERASRPFDASRSGFVLSEGGAVLVLEEYEHAKRRGAAILCELVGYGATTDGYHMTHPAPGHAGLVAAMQLALDDAELAPDAVGYVNAHATATLAGDVLEAQAIANVFGEHARSKRLLVSSTKSMHGHLLGGAAAIEAAISVRALIEGVVPPTANLERVDPEIEGLLDLVPNEARSRELRAVMSNSTGFGGQNAVLVFSRI